MLDPAFLLRQGGPGCVCGHPPVEAWAMESKPSDCRVRGTKAWGLQSLALESHHTLGTSGTGDPLGHSPP